MFLLVESQWAELLWNYLTTLSQKLVPTSELCVPVKKVWVNLENHCILKDLNSTELSHNSWLKEETSQPEMVEVENLSTVLNSPMKTSAKDMLVKVFYLWLMLVQTLTDLNSSYVSSTVLG